MTATTPIAFDPDPKHLGLTRTFKAASAILSGQVVAFADSGVSNTVAPATTSLGIPIGVAAHSQATAGEPVEVLMQGCICTVMMAADDSAIDAGHWVCPSTVAGTVLEFDPAILSHVAALSTGAFPIGYTLEDSTVGAATVGSKVKIVIQPVPLFSASS